MCQLIDELDEEDYSIRKSRVGHPVEGSEVCKNCEEYEVCLEDCTFRDFNPEAVECSECVVNGWCEEAVNSIN